MSGEWDAAQRIARFRDDTGRWPSAVTGAGEEKELGLWLRRQRLDLARGAIDPFRKVCLDLVLKDWAPGPEEAWLEQAREASSFILAARRQPTLASGDSDERAVAAWLAMQRGLSLTGMLDPGRRDWLDHHCALWAGDPGSDSTTEVGHV